MLTKTEAIASLLHKIISPNHQTMTSVAASLTLTRPMAPAKKRFTKLKRRLSGFVDAPAPIHTPSSLASTHFPSNNDSSSVKGLLSELAVKASHEKKAVFHETLPPSLFNEAATNHQECIAPFRWEDISLGPLLGSGEFSHVWEIQSFCIQSGNVVHQDSITFSSEEMERRIHMKKCEKYRKTQNSRYALKHIKDDYLDENEPDAYINAARDLAVEAEFLASLSHPHIIKLRGISYSGADGFKQGPRGYFLIIDRLEETLYQRIRSWREPRRIRRGPAKNGRRSSLLARSLSFKRGSSSSLEEHEIECEPPIRELSDGEMDERLNIALQISAAVVYLHSHSVIFRDLKPNNIGFDVRGDVKIFDFGLARIMPGHGHPYNDTFKMSGAGSPRYMSPELLSAEPYNMHADTYSFSIVLWEMLSGQQPYSFARKRFEIFEHVVNKNGRPKIHDNWPPKIKSALKSSFGSAENRPQMIFFHDAIKQTLASLRGGNDSGLTQSFIGRSRSVESLLSESFLSIGNDGKIDTLTDSLREAPHACDQGLLGQGTRESP